MQIIPRIRNAFTTLLGRPYTFFANNFTSRAKIDNAGALFSIAYLACELVKARTISSLPVHVYRSTDDGREKVKDHPVAFLFSKRWNALTTAAEGIQALILRRDSYGDAYVRLKLDRLNNPKAAYLITANVNIKYDLDLDKVLYVVDVGDALTPAGQYTQDEILHFKTPISTDGGVHGRSLVELAGEEIGLSIDLPKFYSAMIHNSKYFSGYFTTDKTLNQREWEDLKEQVQEGGGLNSAGKTKVFQKGVYWKQNSVAIGDASLVEQQTWTLQQVCRTCSVAPQKVYDLSRATYSNVEQGQIDFTQFTVTPDVKTLEDVINGIFYMRGENDLYVKFDMSGLLRGSYKERMEGYRIGIYAGFFTWNEVRAWEDMPKIEGGDDSLVPQAYAVRDSKTGEITPIQKTGASASITPILNEAEKKVRTRIRKDGDTERTREFAEKTYLPIAFAHAMGGVPYDASATIERIFNEETVVSD